MTTLRIAAAADIHCRAEGSCPAAEGLAQIGRDIEADLLLLAGDLTSHGAPEEAEPLAAVCSRLGIPIFAVLGNHDWHSGRHEEVAAVLREGGVHVLERAHAVEEIGGIEVGIVGTKGFIGGFPGSHLPDFGEPLLRRVYHETTEDVEALDAGLRAVAVCPLRLVVMHYSPTIETLCGEREAIFAFLGTDRLAAPIIEHGPDLVVHGHAHSGTFAGRLGEVDVFNVSVPVLGREFWLFELEVATPAASPIH